MSINVNHFVLSWPSIWTIQLSGQEAIVCVCVSWEIWIDSYTKKVEMIKCKFDSTHSQLLAVAVCLK